jgi:hypothetical protein
MEFIVFNVGLESMVVWGLPPYRQRHHRESSLNAVRKFCGHISIIPYLTRNYQYVCREIYMSVLLFQLGKHIVCFCGGFGGGGVINTHHHHPAAGG